MIRQVRLLLAGVLLSCSLSLIAAGDEKQITYCVEAATTNPAVTATKNGQGIPVMAFRVADLDAGGTFTFTASLGVKGENIAFPLEASLAATRQSGLTVAFSPATVTFSDATHLQTTLVTVTLAPGTYSQNSIRATITAEPASGSDLGCGPGFNVAITNQSSPLALTAEEQMLDNVLDPLNPAP